MLPPLPLLPHTPRSCTYAAVQLTKKKRGKIQHCWRHHSSQSVVHKQLRIMLMKSTDRKRLEKRDTIKMEKGRVILLTHRREEVGQVHNPQTFLPGWQLCITFFHYRPAKQTASRWVSKKRKMTHRALKCGGGVLHGSEGVCPSQLGKDCTSSVKDN